MKRNRYFVISILILIISGLGTSAQAKDFTLDVMAFVTPKDIPWEKIEETDSKSAIGLLNKMIGLELEKNPDLINPESLKTNLEARQGSLMGFLRHQLKFNEEAQSLFYYPTSYFEPTNDDMYILKQAKRDECPGVNLVTSVTGKSEESLILDYKFVISLIKKREKIANIPFPVGKPEIISDTFQKAVKIKTGQWEILTISSLGDLEQNRQYLVWILIKLTLNK